MNISEISYISYIEAYRILVSDTLFREAMDLAVIVYQLVFILCVIVFENFLYKIV